MHAEFNRGGMMGRLSFNLLTLRSMQQQFTEGRFLFQQDSATHAQSLAHKSWLACKEL